MKRDGVFGSVIALLTSIVSMSSYKALPQITERPSVALHAMRAEGVRYSNTANALQLTPLVNGGHGIAYGGGPIMPSANVYLIWYGNWAGDTSTTIIPDFVSNLGGSPYFNTLTTYDDSSGAKVLNFLDLEGSITDNYSRGTQLNDSDVAAIVASHIGPPFALNTRGIYVLLTSPDVVETETGFAKNICGWHSHQNISGVDVKYAWVGNATQQDTNCLPQAASSPNGNVGADGMADILAHELDETVSDPDLNAWANSITAEVADLCQGQYGSIFTVPNGSVANVTLGSRNYLIQQVWVNSGGGFCGSQLASGTVPPAPVSVSPSKPFQTTSVPFNVGWLASPGATWYNVCNEIGVLPERVCQGPTGTVVQETIANGNSAKYRVQGCNAVGCGPWSPTTAQITYCKSRGC